MTRPLTRRQLLERAALGGAALTLPGFLAACGGGDGGTAAATTAGGGSGQLASQLRFANWQLYIDVDEKTKKRPTLDQFTKPRPASPSTTSRRSTRTTSTSGRSRGRSRAARGSTATSSS